MPIIFVHGVDVRDGPATGGAADEGSQQGNKSWAQIRRFLREHVAPQIADDADQVMIERAYWGDLGVTFAWDGVSRPRTPLLHKGTALATIGDAEAAMTMAWLGPVLDGVSRPQAAPARPSGLVAKGTDASTPATPRLKTFEPDQLSDLAVLVVQQTIEDPEQQALAALAADEVAQDYETWRQLATLDNLEKEAMLLEELISARYAARRETADTLIAKGSWEGLKSFGTRIAESVQQTGHLPGFVLTRAVAEFRRPLNEHAARFIGDVLTYVEERGTVEKPGRIPLRVLDLLAAAHKNQQQRQGEPLIVLTHSMGGQIVYDLMTYFLPGLPEYEGIRVDFWCATASQVGLFEEMKRFRAPRDGYGKVYGNRIPFPDRRYLGFWWNVWDHSDFISFTVRGIVDGVDDEAYNSGLSGLNAHSGYLQQPRFFRRFATKAQEARQRDWDRR